MDKVVRERFKVVFEKFKGSSRESKLVAKQLKLQAKEYKRRLAELNHEAARIIEAQSKSISVEKFEGYQTQVDQRFEAIQNEIKDLNEDRKKNQRYWIPVIISIISALTASISLLLLFLNLE